MTNTLTFFPVTGSFFAVADPSISGVVNSPIIQPISALVTFTPRLPKGQLLYVSDYLVTPAYSAEQTVNIIGNATGGTWTLSFGGYTTTDLDFGISYGDLQTALEALPSIGSGNVVVTAGVNPQSYDVLFTNTLASQSIPALEGDATNLTNEEGAGYCEITVTVTTTGTPQITADTAVALPAITARVWDGVLSTIDYEDTPGIQLTSNTAVLGLGADLIYDVTFTSVTFNGTSQEIAPFAFTAPTDDTPVCLTDPSLDLLPWNPPVETVWTPPGQVVGLRRATWRDRAAG